MEQLIPWLQPVIVVGVILFVQRIQFNSLDKHIDDLRDQMKTDHANLAAHLTRVEQKLDAHITDHSIHNPPTAD